MDDINQIVQEKIDNDAEFQATLAETPFEEQDTLLAQKRSELISAEFATLKEQAEKAAKAEELANNYKARAEKAEQEAKGKAKTDGLSDDDILYLAKADIHAEDLGEVRDYAKFKGVSIQEAHGLLKDVLTTRSELRKTEALANDRSARGSKVPSGDEMLNKARSGNLPESDAEIKALVEAELASKLK